MATVHWKSWDGFFGEEIVSDKKAQKVAQSYEDMGCTTIIIKGVNNGIQEKPQEQSVS